MRTAIIVFCVFAIFSIAHAEDALVTISWDQLKAEGKLTVGEVIPADSKTGFAQLKIVNPKPEPLRVTILAIEKPRIERSSYALTGQARWENVEGAAYLEMWSVFPSGERFFTKAVEGGPTPPFSGSASWQDIVLPFSLEGSNERPGRITLNLVMPGRGTVYLGPLQLIEPAPGMYGARPWSRSFIGVLGKAAGIYSVLVGLFAAITVFLVLRGRARRFVTGVWYVFLAAGIAFLLVGIAAVTGRQPGFVFYPLLLTGIIHTALASIAIGLIRRWYERWEFRKMSAQDAMFEVRKEGVEK